MLNKLRPDYVKLDMELTRNVHHDAYKALLARKLFEMAQELELKTVAEGVECRDEWDWVRENGADFVQGYYFAKPATPPPLQVQSTA
jgi:EAL domain-containing protein (putative c-di-GMP-specific phosphodiesterase class I)